MTRHTDSDASLLETIGNTPLVELDATPTDVSVYAKLETFNPGGTIVEPTAGNTGIGMAIAAARLGLETVFVVPRGFSEEKERLMAALGAEIVHVSGDAGMGEAAETAHEIADRRNDAVVPQQFATPLNVEAHSETTGQEILDTLGEHIGAIVAGVGSGGTLMGITRAVRERVPDVHVVAVEPEGSTFGELLNRDRDAAPYKTEGIGTHDPDVTELLDPDAIDDVRTVRDRDAHAEVNRLAAEEGHLVGSSSGAASVAAREVAEAAATGELDLPAPAVVTVFPDGSDRYLSKNIYGSFETWEGKA